ncbi:hypothetical protein EVAR_93409_1 [Eumeta japonica]|uniref:Uncharacterized protein n=1 Tax=Eumeta variegata TaxID=151549 RepID=A0A4C1UR57_EUMVA|nr:hypothetical protein EVAR_93409_1 [Eumeta japonica]
MRTNKEKWTKDVVQWYPKNGTRKRRGEMKRWATIYQKDVESQLEIERNGRNWGRRRDAPPDMRALDRGEREKEIFPLSAGRREAKCRRKIYDYSLDVPCIRLTLSCVRADCLFIDSERAHQEGSANAVANRRRVASPLSVGVQHQGVQISGLRIDAAATGPDADIWNPVEASILL